MKLVCISDTHGAHGMLKMPEGDILIHSGDFSAHGTLNDVKKFTEWMGSQNYEFKIAIAGNHDIALEDNTTSNLAKKMFDDNGIIYLKDSGVEIDKIKFWGSPWTPKFYDWAFMKIRNSTNLKWVWEKIPKDTNVLITHGPAHGTLDKHDNVSCGCELLYSKLLEIRPDIHIFGHIHESPGVVERNEGAKISVNASMLARDYITVREPIVLEIKEGY